MHWSLLQQYKSCILDERAVKKSCFGAWDCIVRLYSGREGLEKSCFRAWYCSSRIVSEREVCEKVMHLRLRLQRVCKSGILELRTEA